jgi:hypothetical protein
LDRSASPLDDVVRDCDVTGSSDVAVAGFVAATVCSVVGGLDVVVDCCAPESLGSGFGSVVLLASSLDVSYSPDVSAPPELRTMTPGLGSFDLSVDPAETGSDFSSDPDPCSTDPSPEDGVDPSDDTIPVSVFESGPPWAGLSTVDASEDGSDVGSATARPG